MPLKMSVQSGTEYSVFSKPQFLTTVFMLEGEKTEK